MLHAQTWVLCDIDEDAFTSFLSYIYGLFDGLSSCYRIYNFFIRRNHKHSHKISIMQWKKFLLWQFFLREEILWTMTSEIYCEILHSADVYLKVDKNFNLRVSLWNILAATSYFWCVNVWLQIFAYTQDITEMMQLFWIS